MGVNFVRLDNPLLRILGLIVLLGCGTYDSLAVNNGSHLHSGIGDFHALPGSYAPAGCLELKPCEVGKYSAVKVVPTAIIALLVNTQQCSHKQPNV